MMRIDSGFWRPMAGRTRRRRNINPNCRFDSLPKVNYGAGTASHMLNVTTHSHAVVPSCWAQLTVNQMRNRIEKRWHIIRLRFYSLGTPANHVINPETSIARTHEIVMMS